MNPEPPFIEPPPLPQQRQPLPPPVPSRKRGPARSIWLFLLLALVLLYGGPLRTEVNFVDDLGRLPPDFEVTLRSGGSEQKVIVSEGHLNLFRYRWQELDVSDLNYLRSIHPLRGREMNVTIERNSIRRLKDAASGLPSVPQRGDPDPKGERR